MEGLNSRILIVDDIHELFLNGLYEAGFRYTYLPDATKTEILNQIDEYEVLVVRSKIQVDEELLAKAINLKLIARAGAGMDNIDISACTRAQIHCVNAPEGNCDAVGEFALAQILNLTRNTTRSSNEVRAYQWRREANRGAESDDLTIAIIGYGHTGSSLARKLEGFNARVIFYDKYLKNIPTPYAEEALWEQVTQQADVVSFHIPLDEENYQIIDKQMITSFSKPFYLLNLSRGKIMKTDDILWGLDEGLILGVALDVLENEQLESFSEKEKKLFEKLMNKPNVLVTPHIAGWTFSSYQKIAEVLLQKILSMLT